MRRTCQLFHLLLPVALFVAVLFKVRSLIDAGDARHALFIMLGALALLALWEGLLLKCWLLPLWGQALGERVYGGTYTPDEDALVALSARIRRERASALMPDFEAMVQRDASRLRSWTELADLHALVWGDRSAALQALLRGAEQVAAAEDRAYLLWRAAVFCENHLHDIAEANRLYARAAELYPRTAYGVQAAKKIHASL